ncbi:MAG: acyl-CoA synthetase [Parahaliea sp.]
MRQFSLASQLDRAAALYPNKRAVVFNDRVYTWREARERSQRLARDLASLGVAPGERVAVLALNGDDYFFLYFAVPMIGAITVPINIRLAEAEVVAWLEDSGARTLVVDDAYVDMVDGLKARCPDLAHCIYIGEGDCPQGLVRIGEDSGTSPGVGVEVYREVATLFYTGGTTGRSKGVKQSHQSMLVNTLQWVIATRTRSDDSLLVAAPMFHMVAGLNCIAAGTLAATLVILPRFDPELALQAIERERITKTALVPAMVDMLVRHEKFGDYDISTLQRISYGGAPMPEEVLRRAQEAMPGVQFIQIYGQTETCGAVSCLPGEYHVLEGEAAAKRRSAGQPVIGSEVVILDPESRILPTGEPGEICVRSPSTTPGYWENEAETESLYRGGWLHTGDIGYLDEDGFLFVVDRLKDMIVTGGENVFAAEVENVIHQLADVEQCAVIGIPSEQWGELVHAVIKRRPGSSLDEAAVIDHCRTLLANFKCVRSVEFTDLDLPVSGAGKILKQELRKPWWSGNKRSI